MAQEVCLKFFKESFPCTTLEKSLYPAWGKKKANGKLASRMKNRVWKFRKWDEPQEYGDVGFEFNSC